MRSLLLCIVLSVIELLPHDDHDECKDDSIDHTDDGVNKTSDIVPFAQVLPIDEPLYDKHDAHRDRRRDKDRENANKPDWKLGNGHSSRGDDEKQNPLLYERASKWRRGGDSNSRYPTVQTFSRL